MAMGRGQRRVVRFSLATLTPLLWAAPLAAQTVPVGPLPGFTIPPPEVRPAIALEIERWRSEAIAYERGDGVPADPVLAAQLYCRAARHGDAEAQFNLAWMLINARGIQRDDAQAAHLFAAAAEQGVVQARNMLEALGLPRGAVPPCLRAPTFEAPPSTSVAKAPTTAPAAEAMRPADQFPTAPEHIVRFVNLFAPDYKLQPQLVLAVMATESNFNPLAVSPKNAQGLMQLIPGTASRFGVSNIKDPVENIKGGMAYLRWLLAYFEGDLALTLAAYNAGEGAVERYQGIPPYAETRHYVARILSMLGGRDSHSYDATVTAPSAVLRQLRETTRAANRRP
ncbi:MAG: transglycosylase SLT domain-containing protein [Burkholderiaceae bacterium]|nr:transglycosylase SLT domain-containing protein [Burkholderiaceae bacterium]